MCTLSRLAASGGAKSWAGPVRCRIYGDLIRPTRSWKPSDDAASIPTQSGAERDRVRERKCQRPRDYVQPAPEPSAPPYGCQKMHDERRQPTEPVLEHAGAKDGREA